MEYQSEIIRGFQSVFYFKCKVCNIIEKLYTENNKKNRHSNNQQCCCQRVSSYRFVIIKLLTIINLNMLRLRRLFHESTRKSI